MDRLLLASMRELRPPVRFSDPVHVVLPRRNVFLRPFEGQPRKYASPCRLPGLAVKISSVPGAGYGPFLREKVNSGQTITLYRRKIISEATAKKLKKQVRFNNKYTITNLFSTPFLTYHKFKNHRDFVSTTDSMFKTFLPGKSTYSSQPYRLQLAAA